MKRGWRSTVFPLTCQFVEWDSILLDGGHHGWGLHQVAGELGHLCAQRALGDVGGILLVEDLPVRILRIGGDAQVQRAFVGLVRAHDVVRELGASPQKQDQQPGSQRVQSAAVSNLLELKMAAQFGHHVMRGRPGWLVDEKQAVHQVVGCSVHGSGSSPS